MSTSSISKSSKTISQRKRFSDDQVKSLETTFEAESRPELQLKQHLANRLGLQPRQVAIWFQNKRARSKSKQIEREYGILKSNYDHLAAEMEVLRKENQTLLLQVQRLRKMSEEREGEENKDKTNIRLSTSDNPILVPDINIKELCTPPLSDQIGKQEYLEMEEEADILNMAQISNASPDNVSSFESCSFLDSNESGSLWWEF